MLRQLPRVTDPNVLVGYSTVDDAAVYRLTDNQALVQTVDFFAPVVDDPHSYGAIAAANALSDVYAMGGRPLTALNIVCFPRSGLSLDILTEILKGGAAKTQEAGCVIVGGHTVDDSEPKYGLAVTGLIDPNRIVTNAAAKPGDVLVLTKPLGIGIITTALKAGLVSEEITRRVVAVMATLNKAASEAMVAVGVNAATDITGYGLIGHLVEMVQASGVSAKISLAAVPVLEEAWNLLAEGAISGGTHSNLQFFGHEVIWDDSITDAGRLMLCDAQTSGGLLIAVPAERKARLLEELGRAGVEPRAVIGTIVDEPAGKVTVLP